MQAALDLPLAGLKLPACALADAVQIVSAMANLPVTIDPDALEELGVSLQDPVSIDVAGSTIGKTMEAIAAKRSLARPSPAGKSC